MKYTCESIPYILPYYYSSSGTYLGHFMKWKLIYTNGGKYEGPAFYGIPDGEIYKHILTYKYGRNMNIDKITESIFYYPNGKILYKGTMNFKYRVKGDLYDSNNILIYSGQFKDNVYNYHGKLFFLNGNVYTGEFLNGKIHGKGEINNFENRLIEKGTYNNNFLENGERYNITNNNVKFVGTFQNNKIKFGKIFKYGKIYYEGSFNNQQEQEQGTSYYSDGNIKFVGTFHNNMPLQGTHYSKLSYIFSEGSINNKMELELVTICDSTDNKMPLQSKFNPENSKLYNHCSSNYEIELE